MSRNYCMDLGLHPRFSHINSLILRLYPIHLVMCQFYTFIEHCTTQMHVSLWKSLCTIFKMYSQRLMKHLIWKKTTSTLFLFIIFHFLWICLIFHGFTQPLCWMQVHLFCTFTSMVWPILKMYFQRLMKHLIWKKTNVYMIFAYYFLYFLNLPDFSWLRSTIMLHASAFSCTFTMYYINVGEILYTYTHTLCISLLYTCTQLIHIW